LFVGLIRVGHSQNPTATIVIKAEWDKFLIEEKLHDLMETIFTFWSVALFH
jgi:hypothetical protein